VIAGHTRFADLERPFLCPGAGTDRRLEFPGIAGAQNNRGPEGPRNDSFIVALNDEVNGNSIAAAIRSAAGGGVQGFLATGAAAAGAAAVAAAGGGASSVTCGPVLR
jgi:hypothetical protein